MFLQLPLQSHNELNTPEDAKKHFLINGLIHLALVVGVVVFGGVALLVSLKQMSYTPDFSNPIILVAIVMCFGSIGASYLLANIYRKVVPAPTTPRSALQQYQVMCLIRWAIIEGGALFCGVAILVTKNILPVILMAISAAFLAYRYPSQNEFVGFAEERKG